jgi:hypothetical protein
MATLPDQPSQPSTDKPAGKMTNQMLMDIEQNIEAKVSKENKARYNKTVLAAETMLFDPKTHANMELVRNPESQKTPVQTISKGVSGLMWLLYQQSKQTLPAEVLIYAGTTTICKVLDFAERGLKLEITPQIISDTVQRTSERLFEKMGVTPDQLRNAIAQGKKEIDDYQTHQQYVGNKMDAIKQPKPVAGGM